MRMTWRKQPSETGLARVCQGPRGAVLKVDGEDVGRVYARRVGGPGQYSGWYWVARSDRLAVPLMNTSDSLVASLDEAKAACADYVRKALAGQVAS